MPPADRRAPAEVSATIFGCAGPRLEPAERAFFRDARPFGFILFARNVTTPEATRALVAELRDSVGWAAPVLIDQEGGRVARLKPPHWRAHPPVGLLCDRVDRPGPRSPWAETLLWEALALRYRLIAAEVAALGVDVVCAPLLDLRRDDASPIIGDRALGRTAEAISARAEAVCAGLRAGGVDPVIKHIPGHGRAGVDSHEALPSVDAPLDDLLEDVAPFRALRDQPYAMTAHVVYSALDAERPATSSPGVIDRVIRRWCGFDGLLMSDDLGMGALEGPFERRAAEALAAGCDLAMHCSGKPDEMAAVMKGARALDAAGRARAEAVFARPRPVEPFEPARAAARLAELERDAAESFEAAHG